MAVRAQVGIVGAGPAGARAGELLAGMGADVVMFDARAPWEKPCGGGLTASAFDNIPDLAGVLTRAQRIDTVRLETQSTTLFVPLDRPLYILSRTELAKWQLDRAIAAGAALERRNVRAIRKSENGWKLDLDNGESFAVSLLVGADGAASRVRAAVAPRLDVELEPTRVIFAPGPGETPEQMGLRFYPRVQGYAWDFPRPDHRSIGIGIAAGTWSKPHMDAEVSRYCEDVGANGHENFDRAGAVIGTAERPHGRNYALVGNDVYALLGDAAGFADPATGEGIQNAIRSADFLAEAFQRSRRFTKYPTIARKRLEPEFVIARFVRRVLYSRNIANGLVDLAPRSPAAYALVHAIVNGGNEHDPMRLARVPAAWHRLRRDGVLPVAILNGR